MAGQSSPDGKIMEGHMKGSMHLYVMWHTFSMCQIGFQDRRSNNNFGEFICDQHEEIIFVLVPIMGSLRYNSAHNTYMWDYFRCEMIDLMRLKIKLLCKDL